MVSIPLMIFQLRMVDLFFELTLLSFSHEIAMKQVCQPTLFWREPLLAPPGEHPIAWHHSSLHRASACCRLWDATFWIPLEVYTIWRNYNNFTVTSLELRWVQGVASFRFVNPYRLHGYYLFLVKLGMFYCWVCHITCMFSVDADQKNKTNKTYRYMIIPE